MSRRVDDTVVFRWSDGGRAAPRRAAVGHRRRHRQRRHRRLRDGRGRQQPPAPRARPAERLLPRLQRRHGAVRQRGGAPGDRLRHRQGSASSTTSTRRAPLPATQFLPPAIPQLRRRASTASPPTRPRPRSLLAAGRLPRRLRRHPELPRRGAGLPAPARGRWPPTSRPSWPQVGINVTLDQQESGAFIDNANAGKLPFYLLGWGADYPDATNFLDFHFGDGASPQFGTGFADIHAVLSEAGQPDRRGRPQRRSTPRPPSCSTSTPRRSRRLRRLGHGLQGRRRERRRPARCRNEPFAVMGIDGQDQFVWSRTASPSGCTAPTRPTARPCGSASRSASRCWPTRSTAPRSCPVAGRELRAQRRPHRVDVHAARRRQVPRRLDLRRQRRRPVATGSSGTPPIRPTSAGTATSPTARRSSAASSTRRRGRRADRTTDRVGAPAGVPTPSSSTVLRFIVRRLLLADPGAARHRRGDLPPGSGHPGRSVPGGARRAGHRRGLRRLQRARRPRRADPRAARPTTSATCSPATSATRLASAGRSPSSSSSGCRSRIELSVVALVLRHPRRRARSASSPPTGTTRPTDVGIDGRRQRRRVDAGVLARPDAAVSVRRDAEGHVPGAATVGPAHRPA